jgi:predicted RND superfamily exporter protein
MSVRDAVVDSGESRFRAVTVTSVTTIAGLMPLMIERSAQAQSLIPMAVSIAFGLASATVLVLVVVPVLLLALDDIQRWVYRLVMRYGRTVQLAERPEFSPQSQGTQLSATRQISSPP